MIFKTTISSHSSTGKVTQKKCTNRPVPCRGLKWSLNAFSDDLQDNHAKGCKYRPCMVVVGFSLVIYRQLLLTTPCPKYAATVIS